MTVLNAMMIAVALIAPQTQTSTHWDADDRQAVSSALAPCLVLLFGDRQLSTPAGWELDSDRSDFLGTNSRYRRARSDGTSYLVTLAQDSRAEGARTDCRVIIPSGDFATAQAYMAELDVRGLERRVVEPTTSEPEVTWSFERPGADEQVFTVSVRARSGFCLIVSVGGTRTRLNRDLDPPISAAFAALAQ